MSAVETADAIVVGARCAGSAAAIALARAGRRVIALDSAHFPSDTVSTHLLWPAGVAELRPLGAAAAVEQLGAPHLTLARAGGSGFCVTSPFSPVDGIDYALCVRRPGLDAALVGTARSAGAEIRERVKVGELVWDSGRVSGVRYTDRAGTTIELRAPLVIGADGRRSTVARLVGADRPYLSQPSGRDCYFAYWRDGDSAQRHIAAQWRAGSDLGTAFPCDDGLVLSLVQPPAEPVQPGPGHAETRYLAALDRLPDLAARLAGCTRVGRVRAATGIVSYFRRSSGPGWALPGDSGHFKDPVTAQGIRDALRYGRRLGEAVAPVLHDPAVLDRVLLEWERERAAECLDMYQWTNRLARAEPMRPLEIELYRAAQRQAALALAATEIFSRTTTPKQLLSPTRVTALTANAMLRGAPAAVLWNLGQELRDAAAEWLQARTAAQAIPRHLAPTPRQSTQDRDPVSRS
ncbi:NAD(P)/FAD-dependent oxidoreductase [Nocardia goodfellowii]|uniref:Flavin-dependent dehydrogenase n=1 Tax=Nocardia goodfellowii TaxID=882446 RepID=A0ABS4QMG3_9NOCA|nr:FAD-dependent monooxygenase [Nocardia goodfellowii]MBP2192882.1 flavin-dependent dehydrogenase [Nocardia goodfellowii]